MPKRQVKVSNDEPEVKEFELPTPGEHLFQVVDILEDIDPDPDIVHAKFEVAVGPQIGRTLLQRAQLDQDGKGFFATRFLLKAIGEPYKGEFDIDTDRWVGRQFYANVVHNGKFANIKDYVFDKKVMGKKEALTPDDMEWEA